MREFYNVLLLGGASVYATCANDASGCHRLFEIADKRLYEAKALGRNRVVSARSPTGQTPVRLVKS